MKQINIVPQHDTIMVRRNPFEEKKTEGGIIITGVTQDKEGQNLVTEGIVTAVGSGFLRDRHHSICRGAKGAPIRHGFRVGDHVLINRYGGHYIEMPRGPSAPGRDDAHGGIALMQAKDILAKLELVEVEDEVDLIVPDRELVVPGMTPS